MIILAFISFIVWFVEPYFGIDYVGLILVVILGIIKGKDFSLLYLGFFTLPFLCILLNCILYYVYLKFLPKRIIFEIGFIIVIIILLYRYATIRGMGLTG
ncbi:hypothetical protein J4418_01490 [Candidatus Woesearchaeota archaeon]|nr:hypothetical protein [Candidatus Woesearchaeota archaeon]